VEAALSALERGVSVVVIFSGFEPLGVLRILQASYIYPYIYISRERERDVFCRRHFSGFEPLGLLRILKASYIYSYLYIYIYIYIYISSASCRRVPCWFFIFV